MLREKSMGAVVGALLWAWGGCLSAQTYVTFQAPVTDGTSVHSPVVMKGMPGLEVGITFTDPTGSQIVASTVLTDHEGRIPVPAGMVPYMAAFRLAGPRVDLLKTQIHGMSPPSYGDIPLGFGVWQHQFAAAAGGGYLVDLTQVLSWTVPGYTHTVEEFCAYYHTWWGIERVFATFGGVLPSEPLPIRFVPGQAPDVAIMWDPQTGWPRMKIVVPGPQQPGPIDTSAAIRARSATIMAHEAAHIVSIPLMSGTFVYLQEAFADYMAATVCDSPIIGEGVPDRFVGGVRVMPRDLRGTLQWTPTENELLIYPYARCQPLASALYHASTTATAPFLHANLLPALNVPAAPVGMTQDVALLEQLLLLDDDDNNLGNGTPHSADLFQAFVGRHGYPWPVPGYVAPVGAGFGAGAATPTPTLQGSSAGGISLQLGGMPPSAPGFLLVGPALSAPQLLQPGNELHVDLQRLYGSMFFVTDPLGGANLSIATPPGLSGSLALQAAAIGGVGYLGLAGSNGLHVNL